MVIDRFEDEYRFLSNFWPCRVVGDDGVEYSSVEHAFQAAKTNSREAKLRIKACVNPGQAKRMGKKVNLREDWDQVKLDIMETLLRRKFSIPELRILLLDTFTDKLVEGNTWGDRYWGVCNGVGENHLGRLLMKIRDELHAVKWKDS